MRRVSPLAVSMEDDLPYHSLSDHLVHGVSGYDTTLDDEQRQRLREFREEAEAKPGAPAGEDKGEALTWDLIRTTKGAAESETTFLLRFMRARNFNVTAASSSSAPMPVGASSRCRTSAFAALADGSRRRAGLRPGGLPQRDSPATTGVFRQAGRPVVFSALRDLRCDDALNLSTQKPL